MIRDKEKLPNYVPNSFFSNACVTNISRRTHHLFEEAFSVDVTSDDQTDALIKEVTEKITSHPEVDSGLPVDVSSKGKKEPNRILSVSFYCLETRPLEFSAVERKKYR